MAAYISHLAQIDPQAKIGDDVHVGPFCIVGPHVQLGARSRLDSHVVLTGHTTIGTDNRFFPNCVIGAEPQDYSYSGSATRVEIGNSNTFREGVTVNRAAEKEDHVTRIGNHNLLMANCHVAHNCRLYDHVVLVNGVLLGGHVHVHDWAIVSGNTVVHHFATLGTICFVGGGCRVPTDVPPYMLAAGSDEPAITTINLVGMQRRGISAETIAVIRQAHRLIWRQHRKLDEVREVFAAELGECLPIELVRLLDFVEQQQAGKSGRAGESRRNAPAAQTDAQHGSRQEGRKAA
jgi:UDP-N-acetylglucosamine acyltransferase